jgi:hypothetical protein
MHKRQYFLKNQFLFCYLIKLGTKVLARLFRELRDMTQEFRELHDVTQELMFGELHDVTQHLSQLL